MYFLVLSIIFNAYIGIIFKYFDQYKINHLSAIVFNYWICVITGSLFIGHFPISNEILTTNWSPYALVIGLLFIAVFNFIAISSVKVGITITQAANKLSLAIPVIFSIMLYKEELTIYKTLGIIVALVAVYMTTIKNKTGKTEQAFYFIYPVLIFLGSGFIDTLTKYVEFNFLNKNNANTYLISLFFVAALAGTMYFIYLLIMGKQAIKKRDIIGGLVLGIPNYFSIYFFINALQYKGLSSSAIIPINNIGILTVVSLFGIIILKEKLNYKNYIGLGLTLLAIVLIYKGG